MQVIFWIIIAAMTLGAMALVVMPLLRARRSSAARASHVLEVYRQQLVELDGEQTRGVISSEEAIAARLEIERRMLRAADEATADAAPPAGAPAGFWSSRSARISAAGIALLVPALALAVYFSVGSPDLTPDRSPARIAGADPEHMDMAALTEKLVARLAQTPQDLQGWMLLGRSYINLGKYPEAIEAYRRAVALTGDTPAPMVLAEYGEALVQGNDGLVVPEAQAQFAKVREILPAEPRSQFYLGLAKAQAGDSEGALHDWVALLKGAEPGAPWAGAVRAQAQEVADILKVDLAALLPDRPAETAKPPPGPDAGDIAAAAAMPEGDRQQMIEGMVAQLAERLETGEKYNVDGWLRLARAYGVLGRKEDALAAFAKAAEAGPQRVDALSAYGEALQAAGETDPITDRFAQTMRRILALEPEHSQALWFLGAFAAQNGDAAAARAHWLRLRASLQPDTDGYRSVSKALDDLGKS